MSQEDIRHMLESLPNLAAPVRRWQVETGLDWTGENGIWIWMVLDDDHFESAVRNSIRETVRRTVRDAFFPADINVYTRFRVVSEEKVA